VLKNPSSLHQKVPRARLFYSFYATLIVVGAAVVLIPGVPLGLLIEGVEALAAVLLPATSVFLLLLCNDRAILGPWINPAWKNIVVGVVVWVLLLLSFISGASTLFPDLPDTVIEIGLLIGVGIGLAASMIIGLARWRASPGPAKTETPAGLDPALDQDFDQRAELSRADRKALIHQDLLGWRTPALETLIPPRMTPLRRGGLITLRVYLFIAAALIVIKIVQLALGIGGESSDSDDALASAVHPLPIAMGTR
jgi:hypothetical protein